MDSRAVIREVRRLRAEAAQSGWWRAGRLRRRAQRMLLAAIADVARHAAAELRAANDTNPREPRDVA